MLGRLRMDVDDCLTEYTTLGSQVFGKPRVMHVKSFFWWPKSKYNRRKYEEILREAIARALPEEQSDGQKDDYYPQLVEEQCRTLEQYSISC